mgnify:CR=1 FL=1
MGEEILPEVLEFEWDEGNRTKSWIKHRVSAKEQEQAFLARGKFVLEDKKHSEKEKRLLLYSKTKKGRKLIVAFTVRIVDERDKIRPISARPMNRKEALIYEEKIKMA